MIKGMTFIAIAGLSLAACEMDVEMETGEAAEFNEEGELLRPDPSDWVFVSASASAVGGEDQAGSAMMAGGDEGQSGDEPKETVAEGRFNIIRMSPESWAEYQETGKFPEGTVFATSFYSMNDKAMNASRFWADAPIGLEVGVKDSERFEDGWGYFRFEGDAMTALALPKDRCFDCHAERAAKDNVFTQLYAAFQE